MSTVSINDISRLANALLDAEAKTLECEDALKRAKEYERFLREETIPAVMQELTLEEIKLDSGQKLTVKTDVYSALTEDTKPAAFQWLIDHNFDGLIKTVVVGDYGRGELQKALALRDMLINEKVNVGMKQDINTQTLRAFLREQIAAGKPIPLDLFGARSVSTAKIKGK